MTRNPEVKTLGGGTVVANAGIAHNNRRKNAAGVWESYPVFTEIKAFGNVAERMGKQFPKGQAAVINGRLDQESWTDKATGLNRQKHVIIVNEIDFAGGKPGGQQDPQSNGAQQADDVAPPEGGEAKGEIPF